MYSPNLFITDLQQETKKDTTQSERAASGYKFEQEIYNYILKVLDIPLKSHNKILLFGGTLKKDRPDIYQKLVFAPTTGGFTGDIDIVMFDESTKIPCLIISTKTSIRERFYQVLCTQYMYSILYPSIRIWFVTKDSQLEFGTPNTPRQARKMAEYFNIPCYVDNINTTCGGNIKPLSKIVDDIRVVFCT